MHLYVEKQQKQRECVVFDAFGSLTDAKAELGRCGDLATHIDSTNKPRSMSLTTMTPLAK